MRAHFEKRQCARSAINASAGLVRPGEKMRIPCTVTEISATGARIEADQRMQFPDTVWMRIDEDPQMHLCRIVWQQGGKLGLEFVS